LPGWTALLPLTAYVGSVLTLILATGSPASGIGIVILIPLIWSVLFHRRWESFVVVCAIVASEIVTSLTPIQVTDAVLLRRVVFWAAIGLVISVSAHDLRDRVRRTLLERETTVLRTDALAKAAEELTTILSSEEVLIAATGLAAQLVSPAGTPGRRAQYTRVNDSVVSVVAQFDETGQQVTTDFPLTEHPNLQEVMQTGMALNRPLSAETAGPSVQKIISSLGVTNAVYVPVYCKGEIDGVLSVPVRGQSVPPELFEYCKAVGHLTELALANARAHETLEEQATTDELTGLANRRAFDKLVTHRPGRFPFCVLALDLDGLKQVNDTQGHRVGDELLIHFSRVLSSSLRSGDMFARLGGDEFAMLVFNASEREGIEAGSRMLAALVSAPFRGQSLGVSIGIASGGPDSDGPTVFAAADAAMYRAKRSGGRHCEVAPSLERAGSDVASIGS
jgi:diguanylate cyclase (GGDEF)-like protein